MLYEVKCRQVMKKEVRNGKVFTDSLLATEIEMTTRRGLDAIKVMPEGKNRYKWFEIPNEYQMEKYFDAFEITISEATTGKNVYKITR